MDAKELRALTDRYRRLLWGVTDPSLLCELRALIAELEMRVAEQKATGIAGREKGID